ncbi:hypothetical protein [Sulfuritalea sp.]|uniref:hypothetical protein n=1 Tax=Sulfuritalea sp. TaxID=2480090 RepID=UPI00286EA527|nr:hypothetical protein [Sulfuritalea sp.]
MQSHDLYAGALTLVMRHDLTGCARSAHQAVDLLERLAASSTLDGDTRSLCEQMCERLLDQAEHAL